MLQKWRDMLQKWRDMLQKWRDTMFLPYTRIPCIQWFSLMMGLLQKSKFVAIYCTQILLPIRKGCVYSFKELSWFHITQTQMDATH